MHTNLINNTISFVKAELKDAEGGHDWFHIDRVFKNALHIAQTETCDLLVVQLGALLHDIADSKFHGGDETVGPTKDGGNLVLGVWKMSMKKPSNTWLISSKTFLIRAEILRGNSTQKNWISCKMLIG